MTNALASIDHAMQLIVDEMFKNGSEEGSRRWEDPTDPLHHAIVGLQQAKLALGYKEAAALIETHRHQEESTQGL